MSKILINKVKKAINGDKPIDEIKEIISDYEELYRLMVWRKEVILSGKNLKKYDSEIKRIAIEMKKNGFYPEICGCDVEKDIIKYLDKFESNKNE